MGKPFYTYILQCADKSYYTGHTDDLQKRVAEHVMGGKCVYTAKRRPIRLIWAHEFNARQDAKFAEARIKNWSRAKKEALIRGDFGAQRELAKKQDWKSYQARKEARAAKPAPRYAEPAARLLGASVNPAPSPGASEEPESPSSPAIFSAGRNEGTACSGNRIT